jgi:hypothetical protein
MKLLMHNMERMNTVVSYAEVDGSDDEGHAKVLSVYTLAWHFLLPKLPPKISFSHHFCPPQAKLKQTSE